MQGSIAHGSSCDRRSHNDSDADSSDSEVYTVEAKLELGRAAVRCTREIMSHFPDAKQSLRQVT